MYQPRDMQCGPVRGVAQANLRPWQTECCIRFNLWAHPRQYSL